MSLWRQFTRGLRVLINRRAADHDLDDEVSHDLDESAAVWAAGARHHASERPPLRSWTSGFPC